VSKSDPLESNEVVDLDFGMDGLFDGGVSNGVSEGNGGARHSGRTMIPATASRKTGRSIPDTDWLLFPFSISKRPIHHLFNITIRRSRSSARMMRFDGWCAYRPRKGSRHVRITLAFNEIVLVWYLNLLGGTNVGIWSSYF
jgi:hypothetical protein